MTQQNSPEHRYARQQQFEPIGLEGQQRIESSTIAVLGCGALGTVAAEILCRAGVGTIRLIDRDIVEWTNLQRQALYLEQDAQQAAAKAAIAAERLSAINQQVTLEPFVVDVHPANISELLESVDLVIDAADNFPLRLLLNDWSLSTQTPWVHGGCVGGAGQVQFFDGQGKPCFRCLVPEVPPPGTTDTCDTAGVLGGATHAIASLQSIEAIKYLSGNRDRIRSRVFSIDFWNNRHREIAIGPASWEACPACSLEHYDFLRGDNPDSARTEVLCGRDSVQISGRQGSFLDLAAVEQRWKPIGDVQRTTFFIRLRLDHHRTLTLFRDGRALVAGTREPSEARSIYDRFVG